MGKFEVLGCYLGNPTKMVIFIRAPAEMDDVMDYLERHCEPTNTVWDGNFRETVLVTVYFDYPPGHPALEILPSIVGRLNAGDAEVQPGTHLPDPNDQPGTSAWELVEERPQTSIGASNTELVAYRPVEARQLRRPHAPLPVAETLPAPSAAEDTPPVPTIAKEPPAQAEQPKVPLGSNSQPEAPITETPGPSTPKPQAAPKAQTTNWDSNTIGIRVPYEATYNDMLDHFTQFGPIDYPTFEESTPGPQGKKGFVGYIRYLESKHAREAYKNSPAWGPRRVTARRGPRETTICGICRRRITDGFKGDHLKMCLNLENRRRATTSERPEPESQTMANPSSVRGEVHNQGFVRPPSMAYGPLIGTRILQGYLQVFTHRLQPITIRDEGQELIAPEYAALEAQLRRVYGTVDQEVP